MFVALTSNPYIPWDPQVFLGEIWGLLGSMGNVINIGFKIMIPLFGILVVVKIVSSIG